MNNESPEKIRKLKNALLEYLGENGRHYSQLSRLEQSVEDLVQALNTRLDQLLISNRCDTVTGSEPDSPRDKLADLLMQTGALLTRQGNVDNDMLGEFESALDAFDAAADLKRKSETAKDLGETAAIKHKRNKL
jgi:tetratricopeptide (TPR) repeat protein